MEKIKTSILDCGLVVLLFSIGNQQDKKTTRQFIVILLLIVSLIDTCETSVVIIKRFLFKEIVGVLAYCSVCINDLTDVAVVVTESVLIVCVHRRHCLEKYRFWCKCSNNYSDCQIISILQVKIFLSIDILLSNNRTTKSHLCFLGNGNTMLLRDACT